MILIIFYKGGVQAIWVTARVCKLHLNSYSSPSLDIGFLVSILWLPAVSSHLDLLTTFTFFAAA
jgi:hypothetical protein